MGGDKTGREVERHRADFSSEGDSARIILVVVGGDITVESRNFVLLWLFLLAKNGVFIIDRMSVNIGSAPRAAKCQCSCTISSFVCLCHVPPMLCECCRKSFITI